MSSALANKATPRPFYRANVHERRLAAVVARALPLALFLLVIGLVVAGFLRHPILLIWVCAILNTTTWLWLTSFALLCIWGTITSASLQEKALDLAGSPRATTGGTAALSGKGGGGRLPSSVVAHLVVVPNYREDEAMLADTLQSLAEAETAETFCVVLAMEDREGEAGRLKGDRLKERFQSCFNWLRLSSHPSKLVEEHQDGSIDEEVPGKASNLKWAVSFGYQECKLSELDPDSVVLTVADADCLFHPAYFSYVGMEFTALRQATGSSQFWTIWQAPQLSFRNYYMSPACSRAWSYVSATFEFGGVCGLSWGGHHMAFSAYSLSLRLAVNAEAWDGDIIAEDHHAYCKCLLYSIYAIALEKGNKELPFGGTAEMLRMRPVMLPVKATSVLSSEGYWRSWFERWYQVKRHAQGVAEFSYMWLACYDAACTLPLRAYSVRTLVKVTKVMLQLFFAHVLVVLQGFALTALTAHWFIHNRMVPMCPDRIWFASERGDLLLCGLAGAYVLFWPVVIPMFLIIVGNFLCINTAFLRPAAHARKGICATSVWHKQDGGLPRVCNSLKVSLGTLITLDCVLLVSPIMGLFGICGELLAYWNVCFYGNRVEYVTASKASAISGRTTDYGTLGGGAGLEARAAVTFARA